MDLAEYVKTIGLKDELIPASRKNRPGTVLMPKKITIHNTSNVRPGADANAHSKFVRNTGNYEHKGRKNWISWHYSVDDKEAIRQLLDNEVAWHAGAEGNAKSIGIEICMHKGIDQQAANARACRLAAFLLYTHGLEIQDLVRHKDWTGKACPGLLLTEAAWNQFKDLVSRHLGQLQGKPGTHLEGLEDPFQFHVDDSVEGVLDE